ncbi:MAG: 50S ribosomal protein L21 [Oligoflexia bacterium]|nr:50S ribosomal protein L21 [Oligoflexia bacterium]
MFAIVKIGNQQFKVKAGDFIRVPFQNLSQGDKIDIPVLAFGSDSNMVCDSSKLKKSKVKAVFLRQSLANKIIVFKKKRRKGYRRTQGHRQKITELKILELHSPDGKVAKAEHKPSSNNKIKSKAKPTVSKRAESSPKKATKQAVKAKTQEPAKTTNKPVVKIKTQKLDKTIDKSATKAKTQKSAKTEKQIQSQPVQKSSDDKTYKENSNWNKLNEMRCLLIFKKLEKENFLPRGKQAELCKEMANIPNIGLSESTISAKVSNYKSVAGQNNPSNHSKPTEKIYELHKDTSIKDLESIIKKMEKQAKKGD